MLHTAYNTADLHRWCTPHRWETRLLSR